MEDVQLMIHLDRAWDWRCFLCNRKGSMLAVSKGFFCLADARRELARIRSVLWPANDT